MPTISPAPKSNPQLLCLCLPNPEGQPLLRSARLCSALLKSFPHSCLNPPQAPSSSKAELRTVWSGDSSPQCHWNFSEVTLASAEAAEPKAEFLKFQGPHSECHRGRQGSKEPGKGLESTWLRYLVPVQPHSDLGREGFTLALQCHITFHCRQKSAQGKKTWSQEPKSRP